MKTGLTAYQVVKEIQNILSGREWTADSCSDIADILRANGIVVLDVDELTEEDSDSENV